MSSNSWHPRVRHDHFVEAHIIRTRLKNMKPELLPVFNDILQKLRETHGEKWRKEGELLSPSKYPELKKFLDDNYSLLGIDKYTSVPIYVRFE